ncbi:MAG: hypothetical protein HKN51_11075 [Saprospiraceae bacterium]|nr:hypothetical protein [Saprospiraceae bacterium]
MNKRVALAGILICLGAIFRLIPHPHNFTPIGAMALVGGLYIGSKYLAFAIPLVSLFISDLVLNNTINKVFFDETGFIVWADFMTYTYLAMGLTVLLGFYLSKKSMTAKIIGGGLFASVMFFLITNFGAWLGSGLYPKNFGGLLTCLGAGVPFFSKTLLSNFLFTSIFVVSIEGVFRNVPESVEA